MNFFLQTEEIYFSYSIKQKLLKQMLEEIYHQDIINSLDDSVHIPLKICERQAKTGIRDGNNDSVKTAQIFFICLFLVQIFNRIQEIILSVSAKAVLFEHYSSNVFCFVLWGGLFWFRFWFFFFFWGVELASSIQLNNLKF